MNSAIGCKSSEDNWLSHHLLRAADRRRHKVLADALAKRLADD
jgi:hypothetical protein